MLACGRASSPINLVDFGTGLFLSKTPSEESGGSGGPHSGGSGGPPLTESPHTDSSSFFPSNIISSVGASVGAMGASVGASVGAMGASVGAMGASVGASVGAVGYVAACCIFDVYYTSTHRDKVQHLFTRPFVRVFGSW